MNINEIDKFFPFESYRDNQREIIEKIIKSFNGGNKVVILKAPFGFGKSPSAITIGRMLESSYYITPQKILQDQLEKDFTDDNFTIVKGRGNFNCLNNTETCLYGQCISEGIRNIREEDNRLDSYCKINPINLQCPYKLQRDKGIETKICNMNFAYLFVSNSEMFGKRDLLICDEAHSICDLTLNFISTTISNKELEDMKIIPKYTEFKEYLQWLKDDIMLKVEKRLGEFSNNLRNKDEIKLKDSLVNLALKIQNLLDDYFINKEPWVWEIEHKDKYDTIKFQPITIGRFLDKVWSRADKILLMSGTILDPEMFLKEVGLNEEKYEVIPVPSNFHYQYNPVIYYPVGKMSKNHKDQTLPKIVDKIKEIISKHGDEKGIIHCHSYNIAEYIHQNLHDTSGRLIIQKRENREHTLYKFINSKNGIFISINMNEGIDLKDDLARYQIAIKVPYPFLGDKRVAKRVLDRGEEKWYNLQAVESLCQLWGRAQRNENDWAILYILDESFQYLWNRYNTYFTDDFINSYKYGIYLRNSENIKILPE